jgi:hypothetical protein
MCAIMKGVMDRRKDTAIAFLCSPTDVFVSPPEATAEVKANLKRVPLWQKLVQALSGFKVLKPNLAKPTPKGQVVNGIVVAQVCGGMGCQWRCGWEGNAWGRRTTPLAVA